VREVRLEWKGKEGEKEASLFYQEEEKGILRRKGGRAICT